MRRRRTIRLPVNRRARRTPASSSASSSRWCAYIWTRRRATGCLGRALGRLLRPPALVTLAGELGTGKTTLVRAAFGRRACAAPVVSPSFTIAQSYRGRRGLRLHHLDLYRLSAGSRRGAVRLGRLSDPGRRDVRRVAGGRRRRRCRRPTCASRSTTTRRAAAGPRPRRTLPWSRELAAAPRQPRAARAADAREVDGRS